MGGGCTLEELAHGANWVPCWETGESQSEGPAFLSNPRQVHFAGCTWVCSGSLGPLRVPSWRVALLAGFNSYFPSLFNLCIQQELDSLKRNGWNVSTSSPP